MNTDNYFVEIQEADKAHLDAGVMEFVLAFRCKRCNVSGRKRIGITKCTNLVLQCTNCPNRQEGFPLVDLIHERLLYHVNDKNVGHAHQWNRYYLRLPFYKKPTFLS